MCRLKRYTSKIFLSLSLTDTDKFKDILGNHCYIRVCSCRHIYSFKYKITDHVYPQFLLRFAPCVHQIDGQDIVHADRGEDDVVLVVRCQTLVQRRCKRWRGQWEWRWWRWYRGHCTLDTLKTCPHSNKRVLGLWGRMKGTMSKPPLLCRVFVSVDHLQFVAITTTNAKYLFVNILIRIQLELL